MRPKPLTLPAIASELRQVALRYPQPYIAQQLEDIPRIAFNISLVQNLVAQDFPTIADIGGGWGMFTPGCAALGWKTTLVDDFRDSDPLAGEMGLRLSIHRELGVNIESQDVVSGLALRSNYYDAVTCFETLEHLHGAVRRALRTILASVRPNGWLILSAPNCVNLRKRITIPFGYGKWSPLRLWYEEEVFRGHVREPDVEDLRYISADLGLKDVQIFGRNWTGTQRRLTKGLMPIADRLLRLRPSLCSNIYMIGRKI